MGRGFVKWPFPQQSHSSSHVPVCLCSQRTGTAAHISRTGIKERSWNDRCGPRCDVSARPQPGRPRGEHGSPQLSSPQASEFVTASSQLLGTLTPGLAFTKEKIGDQGEKGTCSASGDQGSRASSAWVTLNVASTSTSVRSHLLSPSLQHSGETG